MRIRDRLLVVSSIAAALSLAALGLSASEAATSPVNWPGYLFGPTHSSYNAAATTFTPGNSAATMIHDWTWTPPAPTQTGQPSGLDASPTVVNGVVYIGAETGVFYALNESSGAVLWSRSLGYVAGTTCGALGIVSTATVAPAPGGGPLTVYVAGGDGYLYALDAATGAVDWKSVIGIPSTTVNDYYDWSSPTVSNGHIYVGVASNCDSPLVAGGLKEYDQATGSLQNFYQTYPGHSTQPSIWSSAAVDPAGQNVFVTTGNGPGGDSVSVVRLAASNLAREDAWQVPSTQHGPDSDFGGSPTLFTATIGGVVTPMVGACNKNGTYYAWRQADLAAGPVWAYAIGAQYTSGPQCDAAGIWDGTHLYIGGNQTTINGTTYSGSIRMVDPATGTPIWQTGLIGPPIGSPTMDGAGVIGVTQYGSGTTAKSYNLDLINAATGAILDTINIGPDFGQPVFADDRIFIPSHNRGLQVYSPSSTSGPSASYTYNCTNLTCSFDGSASSGGVTAYSWDFGDGLTGSGSTTSHTFAASGTYSVKLTVTGSGGATDSLTKQVTVPPSQQPIAFVASADAKGNNPTESLTVPTSVGTGDGMVLIATGSGSGAITAPAGWQLVGSESSNGVMNTSIWSRVATSSDPGKTETLTFSTTYRKGNVELLAYSGTSTSSPVAAFATHADHATKTSANTPSISVTAPGSWVVSGWETKSSAVTGWMTIPAGQIVRDEALGSGGGRIDMLATDYGTPVPVGTAGGLSASTDQAFTADTTLTLVLTP
jgi:PKD repeat protein/outer membrane protein assembly factor BamB